MSIAPAPAPPLIEDPARRAVGPAVWRQVWQHAPSDRKDDALLERERRGPRWRLIRRALRRRLGSLAGLRTIELGSGRGDLSVLLAQEGAQVTLLDFSSTALDLARERFARLGLSAQCATGDLLDLPRDLRGRYDVSLSSGVLEHFVGAARTRAMASHNVALKPGGVAVVSVPNAWCIPYRMWKAYLELRGWWPYGLEMPFSRSELHARAQRVGLHDLDTHGLNFWQAIGDQWFGNLLKHPVDWSERTSRWDAWLGQTALLFGSRPREGFSPTHPRDGGTTPDAPAAHAHGGSPS
jgi:SAM-dependent methyltransferase